MASFDFADCAAQGYRFFWHDRQKIMRLALIPLIIKIVSLGLIFGFDLEKNYLRQGLLLLPSHFAEGWLIARLIRAAVFGEYLEDRLSGNPQSDFVRFEDHIRAILASTIIYVLIKLCLSLCAGIFVEQAEQYQAINEQNSDQASAAAFFVAFTLLALIIWGFRFLWLYIPAALGYSVERFLKRIRGFQSSFAMIATWLLCFVPLVVVLILGLQMISAVFGDTEDRAYLYAVIILQTVVELIAAIIISVALAFGFQSIYTSSS